jgi:hypothetical protein
MKKMIVLVSSMFILAGCSHQTSQPTPEVKAPEAQTEQQATVEYAKVAAAVATGQSAKCTMTSKDGGSIAYSLKGKKMRMNSTAAPTTPPQPASSMILDEEYMYTWTDNSKQGVKFKLSTMEELKKLAPTQAQDIPDFTQEDAQQKYEDLGYQVNCQLTGVAESEFTPPADVVFTDASAMMENLGKMQQTQTPPVATP